MGCQVPGDGHGDGAPRLDRALPEPGSVRAVPAERGAHRARTASSPSWPRRSPGPTTTGWPISWRDCERPGRVFGAAMLAPHDVAQPWTSWHATSSGGSRRRSSSPGWWTTSPGTTRSTTRCGAEAERLNVPVCFHGGGPPILKPDFAFSEHLDKLMLWHPFNQPLGIMFVATCFTSGGILERFPTLRVGLLEGNCSWAPFMVYRLDEHWEWTGKYEAPDVAHEAIGVSHAQLLSVLRGRRAHRRVTTSRTSATTTSFSRPTIRTRIRSSPTQHRGLLVTTFRGSHQEEDVCGTTTPSSTKFQHRHPGPIRMSVRRTRGR